MDQFSTIFRIIWAIASGILKEFWWIILPVVLFGIFADLFKTYLKELKKKELQPIYLELKFPEEASQKPLQFMELFFSNIKNIKIAEDHNISFEIVGIENRLKFFIRVPKKIKDLITISFYAQYPDVVLVETKDYLSDLPPNIPNNEFSFWGKEFKYKKSGAFPVLTYDGFFNIKEKIKRGAINEANSYDPLSVLIELFNRMKTNDIVCLQLIVRNFTDPEKAKWDFESKSLYSPLVGKEAPKVPEKLSKTLSKSWSTALNSLINPSTAPEPKKEEKVKLPTEVEKEAIKLIEGKINGANFITGIRLAYISPKKDFSDFIPNTFEMFLKQFNTSIANSFDEIKDPRPWYKNWVKFRDRFFPIVKHNLEHKMFDKTITRKKTEKGIIMGAKELVSLFHFPFQNVYISSVVMEKNQKGAPPPNLPFINEDEQTDI